MRAGVVLMVLVLCSCAEGPANSRASAAQRLVDRVVAEHPTLVRLTIHAVPTGQTENRIVACNIGAKIGKLSDPEDLSVMRTGEAVVLREGTDVDVTLPILDEAGEVIAAAGITFEDPGTLGDEELMNEAEAIARELTAAVRAMKEVPW